MVDSKRTGVFYSKSGDDYVVLWQGREIYRYQTMQEFVNAHKAGLDALEDNQADLLENYYRSIGIHSGKNPGRSGLP
ncbi:MAG: hypothetical protein HOC70_02510 [Gammaproteobacteria bacterium]|jgi:hypothetical protein|nr:hypothetical protein [Gammaproteobacteria bacterium]MBT4492086.1 hypothetical protein [Gammaproteobacteria bacterium]MBT7369596.1 hypothetical protein [Gammaproteobacteria bacterium]